MFAIELYKKDIYNNSSGQKKGGFCKTLHKILDKKGKMWYNIPCRRRYK